MTDHEACNAIFAFTEVPGVDWSCGASSLPEFDVLRGVFPDGGSLATVVPHHAGPAQIREAALDLADAWALGELW